jgi:hypothetical protein
LRSSVVLSIGGVQFCTVAGFLRTTLPPDGRFLIIRSGQAESSVGTAPNMVVVQNWFEELKRLVPAR